MKKELVTEQNGILEITSPHNQRYKNWLRLLEARGIKKFNEALMAGRKIIEEVLSLAPERVRAVLSPAPELLSGLQLAPHIEKICLPPAMFRELDIYGTKTPLLLISAPPLPQWDGSLPAGLTIFLPFQNPINLGTTIRTAAAMQVHTVLLQEAATPYLPKALRAAGPAIFQVPVLQGPGLAELVEYTELPLYALSPEGKNIFEFNFPSSAGLVAGIEGPGLTGDWPDERKLSIPMAPGVESLNAAIAVGMAISCQAAGKYKISTDLFSNAQTNS